MRSVSKTNTMRQSTCENALQAIRKQIYTNNIYIVNKLSSIEFANKTAFLVFWLVTWQMSASPKLFCDDLSQRLFLGKRALFDYQQQDVERIVAARPRPFLLNLDMGLGKTTVAMALINSERLYRRQHSIPWTVALIVAPKSVVGNWVREAHDFARWSTQEYFHIHQGSKRHDSIKVACNDPNCIAVVTTYDTVRVDSQANNNVFLPFVDEFSVLVVDEAHAVRNVRINDNKDRPDPARTAAATVALSRRAQLRYALTGTPFVNRDRDLVAIAKLLNDESAHVRHWSKMLIVRRRKSFVDPRALIAWMRTSVISRSKEDVFGDRLAQKTIVVEPIELSDSEKDAYVLCVEDIKRLLEETDAEVDTEPTAFILPKITRLRQLCLCDAVFLHADTIRAAYRATKSIDIEMWAESQGLLRQATRYVENSTKASKILNDVCETVDKQRRVVVASESKIFVLLMAAVTKHERPDLDVHVLTGDVTKLSEREAMLADFKRAERPSVLYMTRQCGGVGINLTCAQTLLVCDSWWNRAAFDQLVDRLHRYGQEHSVTVRRYIVSNSIEEFLLHHEALKDVNSAELLATDEDEKRLARMRFDALQRRGASSIIRNIVKFLRESKLDASPASAPAAPAAPAAAPAPNTVSRNQGRRQHNAAQQINSAAISSNVNAVVQLAGGALAKVVSVATDVLQSDVEFALQQAFLSQQQAKIESK